jgi:hypothetical protein
MATAKISKIKSRLSQNSSRMYEASKEEKENICVLINRSLGRIWGMGVDFFFKGVCLTKWIYEFIWV